ncbi:hypothetical protein [Thalassospira xiamenensis]|uniref:Uncharacterized protein n=1 Tax=Thalassospira xiamenensis TaxID=220697 RepID=A0A285TGS7_9PROT|nr:hypothetical protein [Thalassospira xiamenensis]SOC21405.1 hypothetical protein SAMN05428964_103395 [Thalassospira xiamenensis]
MTIKPSPLSAEQKYQLHDITSPFLNGDFRALVTETYPELISRLGSEMIQISASTAIILVFPLFAIAFLTIAMGRLDLMKSAFFSLQRIFTRVGIMATVLLALTSLLTKAELSTQAVLFPAYIGLLCSAATIFGSWLASTMVELMEAYFSPKALPGNLVQTLASIEEDKLSRLTKGTFRRLSNAERALFLSRCKTRKGIDFLNTREKLDWDDPAFQSMISVEPWNTSEEIFELVMNLKPAFRYIGIAIGIGMFPILWLVMGGLSVALFVGLLLLGLLSLEKAPSVFQMREAVKGHNHNTANGPDSQEPEVVRSMDKAED